MGATRVRRLTAGLVALAGLTTAVAVGAADAASAATTPTTVTVTSNPASPLAGDAVTFTATVSPSSATGSVQFEVDGSALGTDVTLSGGTATSAPISSLAVGDHTVAVSYLGDPDHAASDGAGTVTVAKRATSITLVTDPYGPSLADDGNINLVATTTPADATGTIQFTVDGTPVGGPVTISDGQASTLAAPNSLPPGSHTIGAAYSGDADHAPSSIGSQDLYVGMLPNSFASFTAGPTVGRFEQATFSATLTQYPEGATAQFAIDGTPVGGPVGLDEDNTFTLTTTIDAAIGDHTVTVAYAGGDDASGAFATAPLTVTKGAATITAPPNWRLPNQPQPAEFEFLIGPGKPHGQIEATVSAQDVPPTTRTFAVEDGMAIVLVSLPAVFGNQVTITFTGNDDLLPVTIEGTFEGGGATLVRQAYDVVLDRAADPSGLAYWGNRLQAGTTTATGVVDSLAASAEGRSRIVRDGYLDILRRQPDPSGAAFWRAKLASGMSPEVLRSELISSAEGYRRAGGTPRAYVAALYQHYLDRAAGDADLAYWAGRLGSTPSRWDRQKAALIIGRSAEGTRSAVRSALSNGCGTTSATDAQRAALATAWLTVGRHPTRLAGAALAQVCNPLEAPTPAS